MSKRRTPVNELVEAACERTAKTWIDKLNERDRAYCDEVIDAVKSRPHAPIYLIAGRLKDELGIEASRETIARTLKGKVNGST